MLCIRLRIAICIASGGYPVRSWCRRRPGTVKLVPRTARADGFGLIALLLSAAAGKAACPYADNGLCTWSSNGWHFDEMAVGFAGRRRPQNE